MMSSSKEKANLLAFSKLLAFPKLLAWIVRERSLKTLHRSFLSLISKCLVKLKKFINEVHKKDKIVFWPDLASAHYSNKVQDYLKGKNIEYVPRDKNPANVPELRPIEDFWTEVKRLVYADNWQAENLCQLRNRVDYCMSVHRFGVSTFTRVDRVRRNGLINE